MVGWMDGWTRGHRQVTSVESPSFKRVYSRRPLRNASSPHFRWSAQNATFFSLADFSGQFIVAFGTHVCPRCDIKVYRVSRSPLPVRVASLCRGSGLAPFDTDFYARSTSWDWFSIPSTFRGSTGWYRRSVVTSIYPSSSLVGNPAFLLRQGLRRFLCLPFSCRVFLTQGSPLQVCSGHDRCCSLLNGSDRNRCRSLHGNSGRNSDRYRCHSLQKVCSGRDRCSSV